MRACSIKEPTLRFFSSRFLDVRVSKNGKIKLLVECQYGQKSYLSAGILDKEEMTVTSDEMEMNGVAAEFGDLPLTMQIMATDFREIINGIDMYLERIWELGIV